MKSALLLVILLTTTALATGVLAAYNDPLQPDYLLPSDGKPGYPYTSGDTRWRKTPPAKTITGEELRRSVIASGGCDNHIHIRPPPAIISGECRRLRRLVLAGARYVFRLRK